MSAAVTDWPAAFLRRVHPRRDRGPAVRGRKPDAGKAFRDLAESYRHTCDTWLSDQAERVEDDLAECLARKEWPLSGFLLAYSFHHGSQLARLCDPRGVLRDDERRPQGTGRRAKPAASNRRDPGPVGTAADSPWLQPRVGDS